MQFPRTFLKINSRFTRWGMYYIAATLGAEAIVYAAGCSHYGRWMDGKELEALCSFIYDWITAGWPQ